MRHYLERIRKRPLRERRQILYISTTIITLAIFGIWLTSVPFIYDKPTPAVVGEYEAPSPLEEIRERAGELSSGFQDAWSNVATAFDDVGQAYEVYQQAASSTESEYGEMGPDERFESQFRVVSSSTETAATTSDL